LLSQAPIFSVILFYFFQVIDIFDTAPEFSMSLFAGGISVGDRVDGLVTTLRVSIKRHLTLRRGIYSARSSRKNTTIYI
jgi:hypothetical protein